MMNKLVLALLIIGALNWGFIGFFGFDLVAWLFGGQASVMSRIVYGVIGLCGLWGLTFFAGRPTPKQ